MTCKRAVLEINQNIMCATLLEIGDKSSGKIWQRLQPCNATQEQLAIPEENGCVLRVSLQDSHDNFQLVSFGCSNIGEFVACSQTSMYYFSLQVNRFYLVAQFPSKPCVLAWTKGTDGFALVSLATGSILCCSIGLRKVIVEMHGHACAASNIVIHQSGHLAASNSDYEAILWDLREYSVKHRLDVKRDVQLIKILFCGHDKLITTFKDNSIFVWDLHSLSCLTHLVPPHYFYERYTTVSLIGSLLVTGGSAGFLHTWDLQALCFSQELLLPEPVSDVQQLVGWTKFITESEHTMLAIITTKGTVYVTDITAAEVFFEICGLDSAVKTASASVDGNNLALILLSGVLNVCLIDKLKQDNFRTSSEIVSNPVRSVKTFLPAGSDMRNNNLIPKDLPRLAKVGEYPAHYRRTAWKSLLCLPENKTVFHALQKKGVHSSCCHLNSLSLLKAEALQQKLKKLLSALAFLSPTLAAVDYLPALVFPFLKVFHDDQLLCFEVVLTILANWCQYWFEYYPCPPLSVLSLVENLLVLHDPELLQHFIKEGITAQTYAWPLLQTAFSEVCTKKEWFRLWDHLLSNHPSFIMCVVTAFNRTSRHTLLSYTDNQLFQLFFHQPTGFDLSALLEEAYRIDKDTPTSHHPRNRMPEFVPLPEGVYIDPVSKTKLTQRPRAKKTLPSPVTSSRTLLPESQRLSATEFSSRTHENPQGTPTLHAGIPKWNEQEERLSSRSAHSRSSSGKTIIHETLELRWKLAQTAYRRAALK